MNIKSRVKLNLSRLKRFKTEGIDNEIYAFESMPDSIIGIYDNSISDEFDSIVLSATSLVMVKTESSTTISYEDIESIQGPSGKDHDPIIIIRTKTGNVFDLEVRGFDGKHKDVYAFVHFLNRVVEDLSEL